MNKALIHWEEVIESIQTLSDEYEEAGWRTLVLHPGDVSTTTNTANDRKAGFRLVVPESELDALGELVGEGEESYDQFEVHGAPADDLLLFVVVVKSAKREAAILFPVYYEPDMDREFVEAANEQETIHTDITNLGQSQQYSFSHDKPELFLP
jgi:hypothetical protein